MSQARKQLVALFALSILAPGVGRGEDFDVSQIYVIDHGHSYIGFSIRYMGFAKVRGRFADFSGAVRFDAGEITATSVTARIGVDSLDTNHDFRDKDLKSDQWFDVAAFPEMTFRSTRVEATPIGFDVVGELTIRDVTREVRLVMDEFSGLMKDTRGDPQVVFVGNTTIRRKEFGVMGDRWSRVKEGITAVEDEVEIELTILAKRLNEPNLRSFVRDHDRPPGAVYRAISEEGLERGLATFDELNIAGDGATPFVLQAVGTLLLREGRIEDAIAVFQRNLEAFPARPDLYDSLCEAHATKQDWKQATDCYRAALESDPGNAIALEVLRHLDE